MSEARAPRASELWIGLLAGEHDDLHRSLHDDVGPALAAIRLSIAALKHRSAPQRPPELDTIDASAAALERWVGEQRSKTYAALVSRTGLGDALLWYATVLERERSVELSVVDTGVEYDVPLEPALAAFGFVREQLERRTLARQSRCSVTLARKPDGVHLRLVIDKPGSPLEHEGTFTPIIAALEGVLEASIQPECFEAQLWLPFQP